MDFDSPVPNSAKKTRFRSCLIPSESPEEVDGKTVPTSGDTMYRQTNEVERDRGTQVPPPLLTAKDAAEILGISRGHVETLARSGSIPHRKVGRFVRFHADDIAKFVNSSLVSESTEGDGSHANEPNTGASRGLWTQSEDQC